MLVHPYDAVRVSFSTASPNDARDVHMSAVSHLGHRFQMVILLFEAAEIVLSVFDLFGLLDHVQIMLALEVVQVAPSPMVKACAPLTSQRG